MLFLEDWINLLRETGIPVNIAEYPLDCVVLGTGMVLDEIEALKNVLVSSNKGR